MTTGDLQPQRSKTIGRSSQRCANSSPQSIDVVTNRSFRKKRYVTKDSILITDISPGDPVGTVQSQILFHQRPLQPTVRLRSVLSAVVGVSQPLACPRRPYQHQTPQSQLTHQACHPQHRLPLQVQAEFYNSSEVLRSANQAIDPQGLWVPMVAWVSFSLPIRVIGEETRWSRLGVQIQNAVALPAEAM